MGNFNAKVGTDSSIWSHILGHHGYGVCNERGKRLIQFCTVNKLCITNTFIQNRDSKKLTWTSPDGNIRNTIDFIMIAQRWHSIYDK